MQSLHLSNGATINEKLAAKESRVSSLLSQDFSVAKLIDKAYLLCLSRPPSAGVRERLEAVFAKSPENERRELVEDLFWSLLTSREFSFSALERCEELF